jgi:hypothetical protein
MTKNNEYSNTGQVQLSNGSHLITQSLKNPRERTGLFSHTPFTSRTVKLQFVSWCDICIPYIMIVRILNVLFLQNLLQAIASRGVSIMPIKQAKDGQDNDEAKKVGVLNLVRVTTNY